MECVPKKWPLNSEIANNDKGEEEFATTDPKAEDAEASKHQNFLKMPEPRWKKEKEGDEDDGREIEWQLTFRFFLSKWETSRTVVCDNYRFLLHFTFVKIVAPTEVVQYESKWSKMTE